MNAANTPVRFAFVGFRHAHIFDVLNRVNARADTALVAACEEHEQTRTELAGNKAVSITHDDYEQMLADVECDAIAVGDVYAKRGGRIIRALEAGKHVLSDKPICCTLDELAHIRDLSSGKGLIVGCQLDLRSSGALRAVRRIIADGEIGEVHTVTFSGQHPLNLGKRPGWYFVVGQHGGTINDIAIHASDGITWMTGRRITEVVAARVWNAKTPEYPHFQDGAQFIFRMDNDGGVLGDVSYLAPDGCGYKMPNYWRFTIHGSCGMIEATYGQAKILVARNGDAKIRHVKADTDAPGEYLDDFLRCVQGRPQDASLTPDDVFYASQVVLTAQKAAEEGLMNVSCDARDG